MHVFESVGELLEKKGQELAVSDWKEITPFSVSSFAEATGDRQWIHLDAERARRASPFGGPVAHGFLMLSLLPELMASAVRFEGVRMGVNHGLNKVRFTAPVPVLFAQPRRERGRAAALNLTTNQGNFHVAQT